MEDLTNLPDEGASNSTPPAKQSYTGATRFTLPKKARHAPAGEGTDPHEYTDSFKLGPFTFYVREAAEELVIADSSFPDRAIDKLKLLARAEREITRDERDGIIAPVGEEEREEVVYERATELLNSEAFRTGPGAEQNSRVYDAMVAERYERIIFGTGDEAEQWGGLVAWQGGTVAPDDPDGLKAVMKKPMKLELYQRLIALSRYGMGDELFRRALGRGRR